nr:MAG TPA: hypothetical protein [Caudoviricetes sp.]
MPNGIAVLAYTLVALILSRESLSVNPLSLSSTVSQKYYPSI